MSALSGVPEWLAIRAKRTHQHKGYVDYRLHVSQMYPGPASFQKMHMHGWVAVALPVGSRCQIMVQEDGRVIAFKATSSEDVTEKDAPFIQTLRYVAREHGPITVQGIRTRDWRQFHAMDLLRVQGKVLSRLSPQERWAKLQELRFLSPFIHFPKFMDTPSAWAASLLSQGDAYDGLWFTSPEVCGFKVTAIRMRHRDWES